MLKAVTPSEDVFSITWAVSSRCNYACSYCPPRLHDKTTPYKSKDELVATWQRIADKTAHKNKKYKISFSGGEVTVNPEFLSFLRYLKTEHGNRIANMGFTTNGSANERYYLEAIEQVDYITFSSHQEFANLDKLKKNILATHKKAIKLRKNIFVNVMDEQFARSTVDEMLQFCVKHRIPHALMKIHWGDHAEARRTLQL